MSDSDSSSHPDSDSSPLRVSVERPVRRSLETMLRTPPGGAFPPLAPPTRAEREAGGEAPGARKPVAVLICHGMGQQVKFETLDSVARALGRQQLARGFGPVEPSVKFVRYDEQSGAAESGDTWLPRAELRLGGPGAAGRDVHLYEAYWAPFTEGRVTALDTIDFLVRAGLGGISFSMRGVFDRWIFGGPRRFRLPVVASFAFGLATTIVAALTLIYFTIWMFVAAFGLSLFARSPLASNMVWTFRTALLWYTLSLAALVALGVTVIAAILLIRWTARAAGRMAGGSAPAGARREAEAAAAWQWAGLLAFVAVGLASLALGAWLVPEAIDRIATVLSAVRRVASSRLPAPMAGVAAETVAALVIIAALAAIELGRDFLVQYVGDVAAYVSAHKVSKFYDVRRQIQQAGRVVARCVYRARRAPGGPFEYDDVLMVGHSLGSVVAYDTLNEMLRGDILPGPAGGVAGESLRVAERTRMLLTFGSPLDKTAFIFRTQKRDAEVREALSAAMQPLVTDYAVRPANWTNIYATFDIIGGALDLYDDPRVDDPRRVRNVRERATLNPVAAHSDYWERPTFGATLFDGVLGAGVRA